MAVALTSCVVLNALLDAPLPLPSALPDDGPRIVSARPPPKLRAAILAKSPDTRRNLYVLGLPFDLSLWVSHLRHQESFSTTAGPSYRPSFLISVL